MSASQEELEYAVRCSVECMTELLRRGLLTRQELLDMIADILAELGYTG